VHHSKKWVANVRVGSEAAALAWGSRVCFTPKSCRDNRRPRRQLRAKSDTLHCSNSVSRRWGIGRALNIEVIAEGVDATGRLQIFAAFPKRRSRLCTNPDIGLDISGTITYSELMLLGRCRKAIKVLSSHRVLLSTLSSPPILWLAMEICAFL
jgi:hypothetical protein